MDKEHTLVRDMLLWLWQSHDRWLRNEASDRALELHNYVAQNHQRFDQIELERLLNQPRFPIQRKFVFLVPVEKTGWIAPLLSISYDFDSEIPEIRMRLSLFGGEENKIVATGFRFETPEGAGSHNYYHAQMIDPPVEDARSWLPTSHPAFTLEARNPVTLVSCMLVSLYGARYVDELRSAPFKTVLRPHIDEMHWADFKLSKRYHENRKKYQQDEQTKRWRWSP